jgi:hypothetical protein
VTEENESAPAPRFVFDFREPRSAFKIIYHLI